MKAFESVVLISGPNPEVWIETGNNTTECLHMTDDIGVVNVTRFQDMT